MCFAALLNGDATDRPLREILRDELSRSVANGTVAALLVVAMLSFENVSVALTVSLALGAVALGTVLHQSVLLGGVLLLRGRKWVHGRSAAVAPPRRAD